MIKFKMFKYLGIGSSDGHWTILMERNAGDFVSNSTHVLEIDTTLYFCQTVRKFLLLPYSMKKGKVNLEEILIKCSWTYKYVMSSCRRVDNSALFELLATFKTESVLILTVLHLVLL